MHSMHVLKPNVENTLIGSFSLLVVGEILGELATFESDWLSDTKFTKMSVLFYFVAIKVKY